MKILTSLYLAFFLSASSYAYADESIGDLSARIDDLEKKVGGQSPGGEDYATKADIETLVAQIKELRGRIELLEHSGANSTLSKNESAVELNALSAQPAEEAGGDVSADDDSDDDIEAILKDLGTTPTKNKVREAATKIAEETAPTGVLKKNDASSQYNQAIGLYKKKEYSEAEEALRYYIKQFPKAKQIPQAKLHIAECQLAIASNTKDENAAKSATGEFAIAYKANPKGASGSQALLGMAKSIRLQGDTKKACVVLAKLKKDFSTQKSTMAAAADLIKKYKCS